ncbi:22643_t:CDS:2 [Gigaspora margarita]|uniref:22643_t:CDS:1 n=1 Tax=Gigaspora margarita TaxID=4874 RepID=A0ABN7USF9_GIGMA|nr:22643_t:CDS:2 [Gigaspora margarita]
MMLKSDDHKKKIVYPVIKKACNKAEYKFKVSCKDCKKIAEIIRNFPPEGAIGWIIAMIPTLQIDSVIPGPPTLKIQRLPRLSRRSKQNLPIWSKKSQVLKNDSAENMKLLNAPVEKILKWPFYPLENCFSSAYYSE